MSDTPLNVLFLCTGNSCRSQMAEGFARAIAGSAATVQSAGIEAHGKNPRAIAAMDEVGIDISHQDSTRLTDEMLGAATLVVTVCGHADEHCPVLPPGVRRVHWPLPDPARATGTEEEITAQFRAVRDDISARVRDLLQEELRS
ncbi:arsenate reductase [Natronocella acetinitrilica]|uniref:Arsenate reductase n=1 Tax=Natronocella acetinitrilica TaxID=414046 RepID=A0AAE3G6Q5_9GAMM|nr:arsenate reductase (thioredoxin) [Natronocella acetinitrilica]MCP1676689.1 arsenate reductase [Natronocella acetinitrilica]